MEISEMQKIIEAIRYKKIDKAKIPINYADIDAKEGWIRITNMDNGYQHFLSLIAKDSGNFESYGKYIFLSNDFYTLFQYGLKVLGRYQLSMAKLNQDIFVGNNEQIKETKNINIEYKYLLIIPDFKDRYNFPKKEQEGIEFRGWEKDY